MNEPIGATSTTLRGRRARPLAACGVVLFVGLALYGALLPATRATALVNAEVQASPAVAAANAFLDSLDAKQRETAVYEFDSSRKSRWSNLPVRMVPRNGVRMGDLTAAQRKLALDAVAAVLSKGGLSENRRHHGRGPEAGRIRSPRHRAQRHVRCRPVFFRLLRQALGGKTVDAAIRRASPGSQRDGDRQAFPAHPHAHRCRTSRCLNATAKRSVRSAWKTTPPSNS